MSTRKLCFIFMSVILFNQTINAQLNIKEAFPNLQFEQVIDIQSAEDNTNRLFFVSQPGVIFSINNDANETEKNIFLDISEKVLFGGEQGLLGLAFHPEFSRNGYFYVNYTVNNPRRSIVSRFNVSADNPQKADSLSEVVLLSVGQPYSNHNGGQIAFGPDNYLYISFGDGGSAGDPQNNAQNRENLLGTIARIDVDKNDVGLNYSIPDSNPYKNNSQGFREEIFAYGLRNVWRFSFDSDGKLWAADVGQGKWEEINLIENGKNYGWRIMEGQHCYNPPSGCNQTGLELPIWEYGHNDQGGYSVTGGHLYEGDELEELKGKYIFGDYVTGNLWALSINNNQVSNELLSTSNFSISTFGVDANKELFFANYSNGKIYKFESSVSSLEESSKNFSFKLDQNYPNPFNPSTTIAYTIPVVHPTQRDKLRAGSLVSLRIYDALGCLITTLVTQYQKPGSYQVPWEGSNYPSGIYYYQLITDNFSKTKKMLLLK